MASASQRRASGIRRDRRSGLPDRQRRQAPRESRQRRGPRAARARSRSRRRRAAGSATESTARTEQRPQSAQSSAAADQRDPARQGASVPPHFEREQRERGERARQRHAAAPKGSADEAPEERQGRVWIRYIARSTAREPAPRHLRIAIVASWRPRNARRHRPGRCDAADQRNSSPARRGQGCGGNCGKNLRSPGCDSSNAAIEPPDRRSPQAESSAAARAVTPAGGARASVTNATADLQARSTQRVGGDDPTRGPSVTRPTGRFGSRTRTPVTMKRAEPITKEVADRDPQPLKGSASATAPPASRGRPAAKSSGDGGAVSFDRTADRQARPLSAPAGRAAACGSYYQLARQTSRDGARAHQPVHSRAGSRAAASGLDPRHRPSARASRVRVQIEVRGERADRDKRGDAENDSGTTHPQSGRAAPPGLRHAMRNANARLQAPFRTRPSCSRTTRSAWLAESASS